MGLRSFFLLWTVCVFAAWAVAQDAEGSPPQTPDVRVDEVHPAWADFTPRFEPHVCPFSVSIAYDPEEFRCGYVLVPEDRTRADSRLIALSVLKIESTVDAPPLGALIRLTGGPGGPSLSGGRVLAYANAGAAPLRAAADLIFFDQRGTGYSDSPFCRAVPLAYQHGLPAAVEGEQQYQADIAQCIEEARARGIAVDGYTNWQNALDVRDIRRALGYANWNLFGVSYGTELAQGVMQVDPDGTRAVILDSVVPSGMVTTSREQLLAAGFASALAAVDAMCAADTDCASAFNPMSAALIDAIASYEADPMVLTGLDPDRAVAGEILLDGTSIGGAVFQALYDRRIYGDLPALIGVLNARNEAALRAYVNTLGYPLDHAYGKGMSFTINCRSGFRESPDAPPPPASDPALVKYIATAVFEGGCRESFTLTPDPTARTVVSDIPTLVVTGAVDPITPPYYADEVLPGLSNAQRVDFVNTGHGGLLSDFYGCGMPMMIAFLSAPSTPVDTSCASAIPAPDFLVSMRPTQAPYEFALKLQAGRYPFMIIATAAFLALLIVAFPSTAIARFIDGRADANYGRARLLVAVAAILSLSGLGWSVSTLLATATANSASLPYGVPSSIAIGGWLALIGMLLGLWAVARMIRAGDSAQTLGTRLAVIGGSVALLTLLVFLISIGAGPLNL